MARVLGLTGGSGVGKGTVARMLCTWDGQSCVTTAAAVPALPYFAHVDADAVYRKLLADDPVILQALCDCFGDVRDENGGLNRPKLSSIVFADADKLTQLGAITTPFIHAQVQWECERLSSQGAQWVIYDAPTLFETGGDAHCDFTAAVLAKQDLRIARVMKRDALGQPQAAARIQAQPADDFYRAQCDFIIENNENLHQLTVQVEDLCRKITNMETNCAQEKAAKS